MLPVFSNHVSPVYRFVEELLDNWPDCASLCALPDCGVGFHFLCHSFYGCTDESQVLFRGLLCLGVLPF